MEKYNKWLTPINTILIVLMFIMGLVGGNQPVLNELGAQGTRFIHGLSTDSTSPTNGEVRTTTLTVTGTSTIASSPDGFIVGGTFTISTTSATTLYTNTHGPALCDASTGILYAKAGTSAGPLAPSLVFSVGTSTASLPTLNLVASSTIASSTTTLVPSETSLFLLGSGNSIMGMIGDITNTKASSTYYSNWTAEFGVQCWNAAI